jgi:glycosyltransferase involved in cell wall biosynthesis
MMDREFEVALPLKALPPMDASQKSVAILLATYNGAQFLAEQLDSIERQTHSNWRVFASDDGSSDGTQAILVAYRGRWGTNRLRISHGPRRGHSANFLSLVQDAAIEGNYYAFCDQDDVWLEDKLERAVHAIELVEEQKPALYGSRTVYINQQGLTIGESSFFKRPASLENAMVQSIAGGNTMVINNKSRRLLNFMSDNDINYSHDWATYILVTACGGIVHFDQVPCVKYRQHDNNLLGGNNKILGRLNRICLLLKGRFRKFSEEHIRALNKIRCELTNEAVLRLDQFISMRDASLINRIRLFRKGGFYRQTPLGNLGIWFAVIFKKI